VRPTPAPKQITHELVYEFLKAYDDTFGNAAKEKALKVVLKANA